MNIKKFAFFGVMASIFAAANAYATNPVTQVATVNYVKQNAAAADYNNQTSGLTATTIQSAIDEIAGGAADGATALQPGDNVSELTNDAGYITSAQVPAAQVNADWDATTGAAQILNKPTLATVATSGSYNDLTNTPTIPDISGKQDTLNNTNVVVSQQNGSGNAVTAVTAANGVVTIEKGATFLTAADIAGKQDTITNVVDTATNQPVVEVDQTNGQISVGRGRITYKDGMTYELPNFNGGAYAAGTSCTGSNPCTLTFDGTNYTWTNMNLGNVQ